MTIQFKNDSALYEPCPQQNEPCPRQIQFELHGLWETFAKHVRAKRLENNYLRPFAGALFENGEIGTFNLDNEYHEDDCPISLLSQLCKQIVEEDPTIRAIGICYPTLYPGPSRDVVQASLEHVGGYRLYQCLPSECSYERVDIFRYLPPEDTLQDGYQFFGVPTKDAFPP